MFFLQKHKSRLECFQLNDCKHAHLHYACADGQKCLREIPGPVLLGYVLCIVNRIPEKTNTFFPVISLFSHCLQEPNMMWKHGMSVNLCCTLIVSMTIK